MPADLRVVLVVAATLAFGIPLDALGPAGSQAVVNAWTWGALLWVIWRSTPAHRRELAACVVLATAGELFLMEVWGLYHYRLGNLPWFIPPGHALVFTAAMRLSRRVPSWFPKAVVALAAPYVGYAAWTGTDTQGLLWFGVLLAFMKWGREQALYTVAFVAALVIETYGTSLGGWRYHAIEPWFALTTTNPPVCVGAIYCTLEVMVRAVGAAGLRAPGLTTRGLQLLRARRGATIDIPATRQPSIRPSQQ
jgi:hypothetical protein